MTGTTIAQAIPLAISPILTRMYAPDDFGLFALYASFAGLLTIIANGRYEFAIMLPKNDEDAANLVAISVSIAVLISLVTLFIVCLFNDQIAKLLGNQSVAIWLYFVPLTVLLIGIYQALNAWLNRNKLYTIIAGTRISQSATVATTNLTMGLFHAGGAGLIIGDMCGQAVIASLFAWHGVKKGSNLISKVNKRAIWDQARRYSVFPTINSLHAFSDIAQSSGAVFLISHFFTSIILGYYSFGLRLLRAPLNLIGASVSQVFFQKVAAARSSGDNLRPLIISLVSKLALIAVPIFSIIIIGGPTIFSIIFGEQWREAGVYTQILSPWLALNFIVSPVSQIPMVVNKQRQFFAISLISNAMILLILTLTGLFIHNIRIGLLMVSAFMSIYMIFILKWILKITSNKTPIAACQ
jgi:O-antigen/teichoic acid export membrane protein